MTGIRIKCKYPDCTYEEVVLTPEELAVWALQWNRRHSHKGVKHVDFDIQAEFEVPKKIPMQISDSWIFKTHESKNGVNAVVSHTGNGMVVLFDREAALTASIKPGFEVKATVKQIRGNCIIVWPTEILGPASPLDDELPYQE